MADPGGCQEVDLGGVPFDLAFHPAEPLVAVGLITGHVHLYRASLSEDVHREWDVSAHSSSCRAVRFGEGGRFVMTAGPDKSILATDTSTGQAAARLSDAHPTPINRMVNVAEATFATGDDAGMIKVWDERQNRCCCSYTAHEEFITDMEYVPDSTRLLGVSGDGTLSVFDVRAQRLDAQSEFSEDELLSVVVAKNGRKVICGSQDGVLLIYSWGHFRDCSDRFVGHPSSVEALLKLDEDTLLTGSSDGIIRVVSILPNKMIGVVGEHAEFPIERLAYSHDRQMLGSASHDNLLKIWDIQYLLEEDEKEETEEQPEAANGAQPDSDSDDSDEEMEEQGARSKASKKGKKRNLPQTAKPDFFADL